MPQVVSVEGMKLNLLVYGRTGAGKTHLACTAQDHPALSPVLVLSHEGGLLTVAGRGDIEFEEIRTIQQMDDIFWKLRRGEDEYAKYRTVVIDSGSELQNISLEEAVALGMRKKPRASRDEIFLEDYGKSTAQMTRLMRWYRDLNIHTIVTALPKFVYPPNAQQTGAEPTECLPSFTNKLATSVMGFMDFVWYLQAADDGTRKMLTRDRGIYRAKTRGMRFSEAIGDIVTNPSLPDLYSTLLETERAMAGGRASAAELVAPVKVRKGEPIANS